MSESTLAEADASLNYATPAAQPRRLSPAAILMCGGVALVFLGGCFLIGVMITNGEAAATPLSVGQIVFELVLYAATLGCFGGAIYLIYLAIRWIRNDSI